MVTVAGLFVCARLMGRYMSGGFKIDDYMIFAALVGDVLFGFYFYVYV